MIQRMAEKLFSLVVTNFFSALGWFYFLLPTPLRLFVGNRLGDGLWWVGYRKKVIFQNLSYAFPGDHPSALEKRKKVYRGFYRHFGNQIFEILMIFGPMGRFAAQYGEIKNLSFWEEARQQGKGVLFLSNHIGNWEVQAAVAARGGIDTLIVTKHLKPEWLHQAIERGRSSYTVKATYEPRTLRDILRHLKGNGSIGFVLDQYAGPPVGVRVPLFGVPVGTMTAFATFVKRTGAVVLPAVNYRTPKGRYMIEISPPLQWISSDDPSEEIALNTANYVRTIEKQIYDHPDQWLWIHRRFKGNLGPLQEGEWRQGRRIQKV